MLGTVSISPGTSHCGDAVSAVCQCWLVLPFHPVLHDWWSDPPSARSPTCLWYGHHIQHITLQRQQPAGQRLSDHQYTGQVSREKQWVVLLLTRPELVISLIKQTFKNVLLTDKYVILVPLFINPIRGLLKRKMYNSQYLDVLRINLYHTWSVAIYMFVGHVPEESHYHSAAQWDTLILWF